MRSARIGRVAIALLLSLTACQQAAQPGDPSPQPAVESSATPIDRTVALHFAPTASGEMASIAIQRLSAIDAGANELAAFGLGAAAPGAIELDGWSDPTTGSDGGRYRFADGNADLRFEAPPGTEGLLLEARTNRPQSWQQISFNGRPITVRLTNGWRQLYLPLGAAAARGPGDQQPAWSNDAYFPAFPPTERLIAIRMRTALENWWGAPTEADWRIRDSYDTMMALTLVGMQGIINRTSPEVYLDWEDAGNLGNSARFWLDPLEQEVTVTRLDLEPTSALTFLWRRYGPHFKGAVVYDPDVPNTINLATMLAGLEDRLMLAPEQLELEAVKDALAELPADTPNRYDLPTLAGQPGVIDLRPLVASQGWALAGDSTADIAARSPVKTAMYQWAFDHLWPDLEHRMIGIMAPGPPNIETPGGEPLYAPLGLATRDYLVALRLPVLWLSPERTVEAELFNRYLEAAPSPIPVLSFYNEVPTIQTVSRHGDWVAVLPNTNVPLAAGNLTVMGAIRPPVVKYQPHLDEERILSTLGPAPVVTIYNSDGDALHVQLDRGFHSGVGFTWEGVRDLAFGWTINPTLADLAPIAWNYYMNSADGASFVSSISGAGYAFPGLMNHDQLQAYVDQSAIAFDRTGLQSLWVHEGGGEYSPAMARTYYQALASNGFLGVFATYLGGSRGEIKLGYPGVPAPVVRPDFILAPGNGQAIMDQLLAGEPGDTFFELSDLNNHVGEVIDDADAQGGQAVLFSRENLPPCCMVAAGPAITLVPDDYTVTYRLKVPSNVTSAEFAQIQVIRQDGGGHVFARQPLAPSDFTQPDQYQEFSLAFTLDEPQDNVEVWIDYFGGQGGAPNVPLVADTIVVSPESDPALPRFVSIFIGLVGPVDPLNEDLRILTQDFAEAGGIVLQPDEFLAALNPEYMLELAERRLGTDDPSLTGARLALEQGRFFDSLLQVRGALRAALAQ
jgi:hypothetical protein